MDAPVTDPEGHEEELVLLFRGSPDSVHDLVSFLESRAIPAQVSQGYDRIDVLVAPQSLENARAALVEWSAPQAERAQSLARRVRRIFLLSLLPPLAWWAVARWLPDLFPRAPGYDGLVLTWFFSVFVIGRLDHRRHTRERIEMPEIH